MVIDHFLFFHLTFLGFFDGFFLFASRQHQATKKQKTSSNSAKAKKSEKTKATKKSATTKKAVAKGKAKTNGKKTEPPEPPAGLDLFTKQYREFERGLTRLEKVDQFGFFWDTAPSEFDEKYDNATNTSTNEKEEEGESDANDNSVTIPSQQELNVRVGGKVLLDNRLGLFLVVSIVESLIRVLVFLLAVSVRVAVSVATFGESADRGLCCRAGPEQAQQKKGDSLCLCNNDEPCVRACTQRPTIFTTPSRSARRANNPDCTGAILLSRLSWPLHDVASSPYPFLPTMLSLAR